MVRRVQSHVAQRQDSDETLLAIEHRQSPHAILRHEVHGTCEVIVVETVSNALGHGVSHLGRFGISILCHDPARDIAVGYDTDESIPYP
jgi:hypothetical protein